MRITAVVVLAAVAFGVAAAWCMLSGKPVSQIGVDVVSAATKPSSKYKKPSGGSGTNKDAPKDTGPTQAEEEAAIAEAVFLYEFQNSEPAKAVKAESYFIGLGGSSAPKDPGPEFLKRFAGYSPAVKAASASKRGTDGAVVDKTTAKPGVLFLVERVHWVNQDNVDVQGNCTVSTKASANAVYKVVRKGGMWTVTGGKPGTLS